MAWKGVDAEGVVTITSADIKWAQWMRVARAFQLRVGLKDHSRENFQGFQREVRSLLFISMTHIERVALLSGPRKTFILDEKPLWSHT